MLDDQHKQQLDGIVQKMSANKEPDNNIQAVVDDFKSKYGYRPTGKQQRLALAAPGANPFQPVPEATDAERAANNPMFKGGAIANAASALNSSLDRQDAGQQGPVQTGIQAAYHMAVQPALDTVGKMFSPVTNTTNAILNGGVGSVINATTGKGFQGNATPDPFQYHSRPN